MKLVIQVFLWMDGWNVVTLHNIQAFFLGRCGSLIVHTCMSAGLHSICCLQYKSHKYCKQQTLWKLRNKSNFNEKGLPLTTSTTVWHSFLGRTTNVRLPSNLPWSPDALEVVWHPERKNNSLLQQSLSFLQSCNVIPAQATHKDNMWVLINAHLQINTEW